MVNPLVTVVVPSFNQAAYLEQALVSIFEQQLPLEVFVMDGGSTDGSVDIIKKYEGKLAAWRSHPDKGQSAAINEGVAKGSAPYVCWLNSDDIYFADGLKSLIDILEQNQQASVAYGNCWNIDVSGKKRIPYITLPFSEYLLANYCFVPQPATLIRRAAWERVGGLDQSLKLALDYDLWWKLFRMSGRFVFTKHFIAANRMHGETKTHNNTDDHYDESIQVVAKYYGKVPIKWYVTRPIIKMLRAMVKVFRS